MAPFEPASKIRCFDDPSFDELAYFCRMNIASSNLYESVLFPTEQLVYNCLLQ